MVKTVIIGAAGRMGRRLIALGIENAQIEISGAVEPVGSPFIGQDAGQVACGQTLNVTLTDNLADACKGADVVIDFSHRDGGIERVKTVAASGCGYIVGTTGYTDAEKIELREIIKDGKLVFAYNFSVGINLLLELCGNVATILGDDYDIEVIEMHHNQKVDAPSGTAERLAEVLAEARGLDYSRDAMHGRHGIVGTRGKDEIGIHAVRGGDIVGEHTVIFATGGERIELTHKASSRDTFVRGALRAATFLATVGPGDYEMREILGLDK